MPVYALPPSLQNLYLFRLSTLILCASWLCIAGCSRQPGGRDLKQGISQDSQSQIIKFLEQAGVTGAKIEAIQDRGQHWDVLLRTFNEKDKLVGPKNDSKKSKRMAPGEGVDSVPTFIVYKDGRVILPPALQKR